MPRLSFAVLAGFALVFGSLAPASAVTVEAGNIDVSQGNFNLTSIKLNNASDVYVGTGLPDGVLAPIITFEANQKVNFANGAGTITSASNAAHFTQLTISVPDGWSFSQLAFSTLKGESVLFTAKNDGGTVGTYSNDSVGTGNAMWLLAATGGAKLDTIVLFSLDGFDQAKQFEIGIAGLVRDDGPSPVPLPGGLVLLGSVLAGGGALTSLRRRKRAIA